MNLRIEKQDNITIVNLNEDKFTNMLSANFTDKMQNLIDEGNFNILINLEKVNYMDSSALGSIITTYNSINEAAKSNDTKGSVSICSLNKSVDFLFSMLRINGIINIYQSKEIAIESLSQ
ncbi:MAG: STAS domain-containing protein [Candidatus Kapabacteria bacterium]|nr:STAS domain-containing protein [Ignavibacteriota bacterium]MCW5885977.1 STAS domain-containing protein [Candidatus Kapabacteria bacterium]